MLIASRRLLHSSAPFMLGAKLKKPVKLLESITSADPEKFKHAVTRAENPNWIPELGRSTLYHIAELWGKSRTAGLTTKPYVDMLKTLDPYLEAHDYAVQHDEHTPLSTLAAVDDIAVADVLANVMSKYQAKGTLHAMNIDGTGDRNIPLAEVAKTGSRNSLYTLVLFGADINKCHYKHGNTPLHYACMNGRLIMVTAFVGQGADPDIANFHGQLPIDLVHNVGQRRMTIDAVLAGRQLRVMLVPRPKPY